MRSRLTSAITLFAFFTLTSSLGHAVVDPQQLDITGPAGSTAFGRTVTVLPNGNIVVTDPAFTPPVVNAPQGLGGIGAVYLHSPTGTLISTLTGTQTNDSIGSGGITVLKNGNFVIHSPSWDRGGIVDAGAVTWASGVSGISGVVGIENSLVGSIANDLVGELQAQALSNGNYVLPCPHWNNAAAVDAGAAVWANGSTGRIGSLSASNALVGGTSFDYVGLRSNSSNNNNGVVALNNGNYVIASSFWANGAFTDAGAITWGNGTTGVFGVISNSNSLVGTHDLDYLGGGDTATKGAVFALNDGNYVVTSPEWNGGFGAVTWANGSTGLFGNVSINNAKIGGHNFDFVGAGGITELFSGGYVIASPHWRSGNITRVGAVTWVGAGGLLNGVISSLNSLIGTKLDDFVGTRVVALSNGHYVVASPLWDGSQSNTGAVTWANGFTGLVGTVNAGNSLVGSSSNDKVGDQLTALSNGNYVVTSQFWDKGAIPDVGAVTLGQPLGTVGLVFALNALTGSSAGDRIGSNGITALTNGNFVVSSLEWNNGLVTNAGAATWVNGSSGPFGVVSAANSLIGTQADERVGLVQALSEGNYVVNSPFWGARRGAVTWANGAVGRFGIVTTANSLVGSNVEDQVGDLTRGLGNDGYVVYSPLWNGSADATNVGAVTLAAGGGIAGAITGINSVRGTAPNGGPNLVYDYDSVRKHLIVGRPDSNIVSIFNLPDIILVDGFETAL